MEFEHLGIQLDGRVLTLTLKGYKGGNALSDSVMKDLATFFGKTVKDLDVGCIIFEGLGENFCAGANLEELKVLDQDGAEELSKNGQFVFSLIEDCGVPVIARVRGYTLGGGLELAMACTLRYALADATFGQPEVTLGFPPGYLGTWRLVHLIGQGRAMEMLTTGKMINGQMAESYGLVNQSYPDWDTLVNATNKIAQKIAGLSLPAVCRLIQLVNYARYTDRPEAGEMEARLFGECFKDGKAAAGIAAWEQKQAEKKKQK